jgi:hypothetical protein
MAGEVIPVLVPDAAEMVPDVRVGEMKPEGGFETDAIVTQDASPDVSIPVDSRCTPPDKATCKTWNPVEGNSPCWGVVSYPVWYDCRPVTCQPIDCVPSGAEWCCAQ